MKKVLPIFSIVVILGLCAGIAAQFQTITRLQRQLAETQQQSAVREVEAQKEVVRLRETNEALTTESETLRKNRGLAAAAPGTVPAANGTGAAPSGGTAGKGEAEKGESGSGEGSFFKGIAKMWTDPAMKKMMRQQQSMGMRMMYGDLAKELGLNSDQLDKVMELLTDRQMELTSKSMEMLTTPGDTAKVEAGGKAVNDARAAFDEKLKDVIGDDGLKQLQNYEKTMGDRFMMQQYGSQFEASGAPLGTEQRDGLLRLLAEERSRTPPTVFDPTNKDVASQMKAMQSDEALHKYLASQEDFNVRVLRRAGEVLSPEQVTAFEKIQKQMLEMQQAGIKMSRAMFQTK